jgi:hypothetical protein
MIGVKYIMNSSNKEKITFVANAETRGNGEDSTTMDYFQGFQYPHLSLLVPHLIKSGYKIEVVDWKDKNVDWTAKGKVILGPVWGYTKDVQEFIKWLDTLDKQGVNMVNHPAFFKWNIQKKYLINLQDNGMCIPKTLIITSDDPMSFDEARRLFYKKFGHKDIILKGVIDAGGFGYMHLRPDQIDGARQQFNTLKHNNHGVVMQSFLPQIYTQGELAFVFVDGKISHFFVKVAKYEEERVQPFYGGRSFHFTKGKISEQISHIKLSFRKDIQLKEIDVQNAYIQAQLIYSKLLGVLDQLRIPHPQYLRMDGVMVDCNFVIMELEGIEPYLEIQEAMNNDPQNNVIRTYVECVVKK